MKIRAFLVMSSMFLTLFAFPHKAKANGPVYYEQVATDSAADYESEAEIISQNVCGSGGINGYATNGYFYTGDGANYENYYHTDCENSSGDVAEVVVYTDSSWVY